MTSIVFDIETGPLPDIKLDALMPDFEPAANLKDPEKIAADLAKKRIKFKEDAALSPLSGRVLAVGFLPDHGDPPLILADDDEGLLLASVWNHFRTAGGSRRPTFVGFNIHGFDLPFLVKRSWVNGVDIPPNVRQGRYWADWLVDLRETWQLGDRQAHGSLDTICRALGLGEKNGSGADFPRLWKEEREQAVKYLLNDLTLTAKLAARLLPVAK